MSPRGRVRPGAPSTIRAEARAASALNHPSIVTIYEVGEHEGTPFIAMEYIEGVTIREMIDKGPLPNDMVIRYGAQMAEGLAKAHKPESFTAIETGEHHRH